MNQTTVQPQEPITDDIEKLIYRWKNEEGNLIMIFHGVQKHYGYVPRNVCIYVADELNIPLSRIYEIITFYNYFNMDPPAQNTITVCMGTACYLKGAGDLIDEIKKILNLKGEEQYTQDRKFKLEEVRCIGCCGLAPVLTFNGEVHGRVTIDKIPQLLALADKEKEA